MKKILSVLLAFFLLPVVGCAKAPDGGQITPVGDTIEQGITLQKCLEYDNARWQRIEARFVADVLERMPREYKLYDSSELSAEILESRNGVVIIERCIGFVTDKTTGDGEVLNAYDADYNYISYRSDTSSTYRDGTVFISYMVYNHENNCIDDIIARYDFVLCRDWED